VTYDTVVGHPSSIHFTRSYGSSCAVDVNNFNIMGTHIPTPSPSANLQLLTQAHALWDSPNIQEYMYQISMCGMDPRRIVYPWTSMMTTSDKFWDWMAMVIRSTG
jgi:hypothetical protein